MKYIPRCSAVRITAMILSMFITIPAWSQADTNNFLVSVYQGAVAGDSRIIELQPFIDAERNAYQGTITIVPPLNISFNGVIKSLPEKKSFNYLYKALDLMQVQPLPAVEHQMFIGAPNGDVIAVYVDARVADQISQSVELETIATWYGYHIYSYSRGPAIVIENVDLAVKSH